MGNREKEKNVSFRIKGDIDESYYIQTIQDLNREIAQNSYNRADGNGDVDSPQPMGIDTKKSLLSKIHTKNQYIRRLLCENEALRHQIDKLNERNLQLDICLKQTTNQLTKANSDIVELKRQNNLSADDIMMLNQRLDEIGQEMHYMEKEKLKYQTDILFLGQEIHKRVNKWNDALRKKRERAPQLTTGFMEQQMGQKPTHVYQEIKNVDDSKRVDEVIILSQAVVKRNALILELESLLTNLTLEIAHSAEVINNLAKNFSIRENHFTENIEKLQEHLFSMLHKQRVSPREADSSAPKQLEAPPPTNEDPPTDMPENDKSQTKIKLRKKKRQENIL